MCPKTRAKTEYHWKFFIGKQKKGGKLKKLWILWMMFCLSEKGKIIIIIIIIKEIIYKFQQEFISHYEMSNHYEMYSLWKIIKISLICMLWKKLVCFDCSFFIIGMAVTFSTVFLSLLWRGIHNALLKIYIIQRIVRKHRIF